MLNFTAKEFAKMLAESDNKIEGLKSELTTVGIEIEQLNRKQDGIKKDLKNQENKSEAIRRALILVQGVSSKISQMRNKLLKTMERAGREDITIDESKNLRTEVGTLQAQLQKACAHPFVYDEPGYEGSLSYDFEDRHPGVRYCVVCGFSEEIYQTREVGALGFQREYLFKILTPDDKRIIEDQPWTSQGRKRVNIWIPLGAALKPFEDSVVRVLNS